MYILKNALRNITRVKTRNLLIGFITLIIALASAISITIMSAAKEAERRGQEGLSISASISINRQNIMEKARSSGGDPRESLSSIKSLTLDELKSYADSSYVKDFSYQLTTSMSGSTSLTAVTTGDSNRGKRPSMDESMTQGDFTLTGYSSDQSMTDFMDGTKTMVDGSMFQENTTAYEAVISQELATLNNLKVGSAIQLTNPNNTSEVYTLTVKGIFESKNTADNQQGMPELGQDSANQIIMSYNSLQSLIDQSTTLTNNINGIFEFNSVSDYENFQKEVVSKGLSEDYQVVSRNLQNFENSMIPLKNLSSFAMVLLIIVLVVGVIVLVVLNMINLRERKYEIGVLTAIGMKKSKVALQFVLELLTVTFVAIFLGTGIGALLANPVGNQLLASQIASEITQKSNQEANFGRPNNGVTEGSPRGFVGNENYVSTIDTSMSPVIFIQLLGIGVLLTILSSAGSIIIIMRYEPLKILSNRS